MSFGREYCVSLVIGSGCSDCEVGHVRVAEESRLLDEWRLVPTGAGSLRPQAKQKDTSVPSLFVPQEGQTIFASGVRERALALCPDALSPLVSLRGEAAFAEWITKCSASCDENLGAAWDGAEGRPDPCD